MNNIYLRPLVERDAEISFKWRNNPVIWKYTGTKPNTIITYEIELNWIREVLKREDERRFAICVVETDEYIGNVQLTNINTKTAQYHLFIGETSFWGKGVASRAICLILEFAFSTLKLNEVYAYFNSDNIASIRACEKNGFEFSLKGNNGLMYTCNLKNYERAISC